jgi:hypothetical protein
MWIHHRHIAKIINDEIFKKKQRPNKIIEDGLRKGEWLVRRGESLNIGDG